MDPGTDRRVGNSNSKIQTRQATKPAKRPHRNSSSAASQPPSSSAQTSKSPSKKKRRRKGKKEEQLPEGFWSLKDEGILDERTRNGALEYLCDWANDPKTGQSFEPTWEPPENVTPDVIKWWRAEKARKADHLRLYSQEASSLETTEQSQPTPHNSKRRRDSLASLPSPSQPTSKKQRVASEKEIKDSYEEPQENQEQLFVPVENQVQVEISVNTNFDRSAYVAVASSSSQSQGNQEPTSSSPQTPVQTRKRRSRPFIWDELVEGGVIPDSQEEDDIPSSSFRPAQTQASPGFTTQDIAEPSAESERDTSDIRTTQDLDSQVSSGTSGSGVIDSQLEEPARELASASYIPEATQADRPTSSSANPESSSLESIHSVVVRSQSQIEDSQESSELVTQSVAETSSIPAPAATQAELVESSSPEEQDPLEVPSTEAEDEPSDVTDTLQHEPTQSQVEPIVSSPISSSPEVSIPRLEIIDSSRSEEQEETEIPSAEVEENSSEIPGTPQQALNSSQIDPIASSPVPSSLPEPVTIESSGLGRQEDIEIPSVIVEAQPVDSSQIVPASQVEPSISSNPVPSSIPAPTIGQIDSSTPAVQEQTKETSQAEERLSQSTPSQIRSIIASSPVVSNSVPTPSIDRPSQALFSSQPHSRQETELHLPLSNTAIQRTSLPPIRPIERYLSRNSVAHSEPPRQAANVFAAVAPSHPPFPSSFLPASGHLRPLLPQGSPQYRSPYQVPQAAPQLSIPPGRVLPPPAVSNSHPPPWSPVGDQFPGASRTSRTSRSPDLSATRTGRPENQSQSRLAPLRSFRSQGSQTFQALPIESQTTSSQGSQRPEHNHSQSSSAHSHLLSPPLEEDSVLPSIEQDSVPESSLVVPKPSPLVSSSPLKYPSTYGSQPPIRPSPGRPSSGSSIMAGLSDAATAAKMKQMLERFTTKKASESSTVADQQVNQQSHALNQALPSQNSVDPIVVPTTYTPPPRPTPSLEIPPTSLNIVDLDPNEFIVPLPIVAQIRDAYHQTIKNRKDQRLEFVREPVIDSGLLRKIDDMLDGLAKLCDHPDLIIEDPSTQRMDEPEAQAKYAETISTKCIFLAELLPLIQQSNEHVVIVARGGRTLEIIESILRFHDLGYTRADHGNLNLSEHPLKITLVPSDQEVHHVALPTVVIAFDSTARSSPYLRESRSAADYGNPSAPVLSLIVSSSFEHLNRCFSKDIEATERKIRLVDCISQIGGNVGELTGDFAPPEMARAVAGYIANGAPEGTWPLLPMPNIEGLNLEIENSQAESSAHPSNLTTQSNNSTPSAQVSNALKRQLGSDGMLNADSPKRPRLSASPQEQPQGQELTHISETVIRLASSQSEESSSQQTDQAASLLRKINDLESMNRALEIQVTDLQSSVETIQPKYQEALNDRGHFQYEVELALRREFQTQKDRDAAIAKAESFKKKNEELQAELETIREGRPDLKELHNSIHKIERLEKKIASMDNDLSYTREMYQNASTAAAESASEIQDLKTQLATMTEKADANRVKIHEIQTENAISEYVKRIREKTLKIEELETELEKKTEELRAVLNGRRPTRGTSVPRSPRMGTMSPRGLGIARNNVGGSRGNSPAPNELFGGAALFQGGGNAGGRWGQHLI